MNKSFICKCDNCTNKSDGDGDGDGDSDSESVSYKSSGDNYSNCSCNDSNDSSSTDEGGGDGNSDGTIQKQCVYILENIISHCQSYTIFSKLEVILGTQLAIFIIHNTDKNSLICNYASDSINIFKQGVIYNLENFDNNMYKVKLYYRKEYIGILVLDNDIIWNNLNYTTQKLVNNIICITVVLSLNSTLKYQTIQIMCKSLHNIIEKINNICQKYDHIFEIKEIQPYLLDMTQILYDIIDFIQISENQIAIQENIVNVSDYFTDTCKIIKTLPNFKSDLYLKIEKDVPKLLIFDQEHLTQFFVLFFKLNCTGESGSDKGKGNVTTKIKVMYKNTLNVHILYTNVYKLPVFDYSISIIDRLYTNDLFIIKKLCNVLNIKINQSGNEFVVECLMKKI